MCGGFVLLIFMLIVFLSIPFHQIRAATTTCFRQRIVSSDQCTMLAVVRTCCFSGSEKRGTAGRGLMSPDDYAGKSSCHAVKKKESDLYMTRYFCPQLPVLLSRLPEQDGDPVLPRCKSHDCGDHDGPTEARNGHHLPGLFARTVQFFFRSQKQCHAPLHDTRVCWNPLCTRILKILSHE